MYFSYKIFFPNICIFKSALPTLRRTYMSHAHTSTWKKIFWLRFVHCVNDNLLYKHPGIFRHRITFSYLPTWSRNEPGNKTDSVGVLFFQPCTWPWGEEVWLLKQQILNRPSRWGNMVQETPRRGKGLKPQQTGPWEVLPISQPPSHFGILFWVKWFHSDGQKARPEKPAVTGFGQCRQFPGENTTLFLLSLNLLKTCLFWHFSALVWFLVFHSLRGLDYTLWPKWGLGVS